LPKDTTPKDINPLVTGALPIGASAGIGAGAGGSQDENPHHGAGGSWDSSTSSNNESLDTVKEMMLNAGILQPEELTRGTGRQARRISPQEEESIIRSKIPALRQIVSKQRNASSIMPLLSQMQ
jgi:hypothetical protein